MWLRIQSAPADMKRQSSRQSPVIKYIGLLAGLLVPLTACWVCASLLSSVRTGPSPASRPAQVTLRVACSPEKATTFKKLTDGFNKQGLRTDDGQALAVEMVEMDPEAMIDAALSGQIQAMTPDSSIWLDQLDRAWMDKTGGEVPLVGERVRYAVSPVVIAAWESVARELGYPGRPVGWQDILTRARQDPNFHWSHPSTASASGVLATLAEFYAGAGKTRGLTNDDVQSKAVIDYVSALEKTVRFYGEGEWAIIQRALSEGPGFLDAFIVQEQLVIYFNQQGRAGYGQVSNLPLLVAIYPIEGTLWQDHPLALLETPDLTAGQRLAFARLQEYLLSKDAQYLLLEAGYRPADLSISLNDPRSPITSAYGVDPREPQTALQIPGPAVVERVRDVWWLTKRHTNVYLVVDTSGSMQGSKLSQAQEALRVFIQQIKGDAERVGLIEFGSSVKREMTLEELGRNRGKLLDTVDNLEANGHTALLDAIYLAYRRLQDAADRERINAIVVMTDGLENNSSISLSYLISQIRTEGRAGVPVVIFCIAYGSDADYDTLQTIAEATGGQVRKGDLETIRGLYKILSTYF
jgi:Ca-activated chloride channel family protein